MNTEKAPATYHNIMDNSLLLTHVLLSQGLLYIHCKNMRIVLVTSVAIQGSPHVHVVASGQLPLVSYKGSYTVSDYLIMFPVTGFLN